MNNIQPTESKSQEQKGFIDFIYDMPVISTQTKNEICRRYVADIKKTLEEHRRSLFGKETA